MDDSIYRMIYAAYFDHVPPTWIYSMDIADQDGEPTNDLGKVFVNYLN